MSHSRCCRLRSATTRIASPGSNAKRAPSPRSLIPTSSRFTISASDNGVHYAVTELLEGQTLRDLVRGGALSPPKATAIATQIARGLEAAHARGIVHRDLKPDNVFVLNDGQVKILDFGLAKAAPSSLTPPPPRTAQTVTGGLTSAGMVLGTAGYMAPEQVRGGAIDHRADIFALGCILYELLAGRRAFQGDSSIDTMHATLHADPPIVATLAAVPEALSRIVGHCLEKQPANRFQTATDLRFALDAIGDGSRNATPAPRRRWPSMMPVTVATCRHARRDWRWAVGIGAASRGSRSTPRPRCAAGRVASPCCPSKISVTPGRRISPPV